MSGNLYWPASSPRDSQGEVSVSGGSTPALWNLVERITPGYEPSYEDCKVFYVYHPLGARIVDAPIYLAFHRPRQIAIDVGPQDELVEAFNNEWNRLGDIGALRYIIQTVRLSAIYGIAAIGVGVPGVPTDRPLTDKEWLAPDLYFQVFDSLNTAGSLTLSQDPGNPNFLKPRHFIVNDQVYHLNRGVVLQNEDPLYIQWTSSAFGFTGRSKYMRAMYPMASYVRMMVAQNKIAEKLALLITKVKSPGSIVDRVTDSFFRKKLQQIRVAATGNVASIDIDESIETLNMMNVDGAGKFALDGIVQDIASGAGMPALLLTQDTLAEGFADGSEDAKQIAAYIESYRSQQEPIFRFFDRLVQRRAWTREFWQAMRSKYPETMRGETYAASFQKWCDAFTPGWPSLVQQSDKEELEGQQKRFDSVVKLLEVLGTLITEPQAKADIIDWAAANINIQKKMFAAPLTLDTKAIADHESSLPAPTAQETPKNTSGDDT